MQRNSLVSTFSFLSLLNAPFTPGNQSIWKRFQYRFFLTTINKLIFNLGRRLCISSSHSTFQNSCPIQVSLFHDGFLFLRGAFLLLVTIFDLAILDFPFKNHFFIGGKSKPLHTLSLHSHRASCSHLNLC